MAIFLSGFSINNPGPRSGLGLIQLSTYEWAGEVLPGLGPGGKQPVLPCADHYGSGEVAYLINRQQHPQLEWKSGEWKPPRKNLSY